MAEKTAGSSASPKKPLPLTKGHVQSVFEKTKNLHSLCSTLNIPVNGNPVEYYSQRIDPRKVRRMVFYLDCYGDTALADTVMECAEPPADPSLTPHHLIPVFQALTGDWKHISRYRSYSSSDYTIVPEDRAQLFQEKFSARDQLCSEAGKYYILYHYDPNWKELSHHLYRAGETEALQIARPHVQTVADPSLTPDNILQATHDIPLWTSEDSYECLNMPESLHEEIAGKYDGEQSKCELVSTWLAGHPWPTWEHVKYLLEWLERQGRGREGAAEEVEETYLQMTPEKAQQILDAALLDGSLPQGYLKTLAAGAARSGKTLSKKHIFRTEYDPNCSSSTGVCEAPIHAIRSISCELIRATVGVFSRLTQKYMNEILARKLQRGFLQGNVAEIAAEIVESFLESKETSPTPAPVPAATSSVVSAGESKAKELVTTALCEKGTWRYNYDSSDEESEPFDDDKEELFKLQVILFLDSGGQPQFHELLPALSHNVCLVLLFVKLNERLDALCCTAFTDKEGKWFVEKCSSLLTNEQMLVQFVHTMMCKPLAPGDGMRTMFMVIGTHRDLIHECDETLAQKNERLASLFLPALEEVLIMNGNDIIFDVNAKNPDDYDEKRFDLIRRNISDLSVALEVETPMSFLMFQNDLIGYGKEQRKRVVSMEECQTIAGRLKMDRQVLEAALIHFNKLSMFLYLPSVLPGRVFIDPQMPLDSVNRIVAHSYKVGCGAVPGLAPSESRLWKEGVVTSEMLKGDEFSSCFVSGLFEADDALKFFHSLYITAPLSESEFIMPAMLQTVSRQYMKQYLPAPSEHVAPLLLHFHKSRIANGIFCSTHTCIRSEYGWTTSYVVREGKTVPTCLYRNAVTLQHPSEQIELTFIHAQKHFEVYVDADPQSDLSRVCPQIRDMLVDAVDKAATAFRLTKSRASVAFQCPCSPDDVHTAIPNEGHSRMKCTLTGRISRLTEAQKVWLHPTDTQFVNSKRRSWLPRWLSKGMSRLFSHKSKASPHSEQPQSSPLASASSSSQHTTQSTAENTSCTRTSASSSSQHTTQSTAENTSSTQDKRPSLPKLLCFRTSTGTTINIMSQVGTHYTNLGLILLDDEDGALVEAITSQFHENAVRITREILTRWIRGEGIQPVTWRTLIDTLRDIGLTELATSMHQSL